MTTSTDDWQPIETAPEEKDITRILVWAGGVHIAEWDGHCWIDHASRDLHPTHWMPLPLPPGDKT